MGLRTRSAFPSTWLGSKQESLDKEWTVASDGEGVKGVPAGGVSIPYRNTDLT